MSQRNAVNLAVGDMVCFIGLQTSTSALLSSNVERQLIWWMMIADDVEQCQSRKATSLIRMSRRRTVLRN